MTRNELIAESLRDGKFWGISQPELEREMQEFLDSQLDLLVPTLRENIQQEWPW